jgi:excisionase family DNA binding protein
MISFNPQISPFVVNNHITVKAAAEFSGYSLQYLRRLLRSERLAGIKIGQVWLIEKDDFMAYLEKVVRTTDRRFGPQ